jgi:YggT family protein
MSYLVDAGALLIEVLFGLACSLFLIRVLLQLVGANFYNPICQFVYETTNPVLLPLRKLLPTQGRFDLAGTLVALLLQVLKVLLLALLVGAGLSVPSLLLLGVVELLSLLLGIYFWLILARAVLSFVGVDRRHPALPLLAQLTEPVLGPLRRALPATGAIDLSPMLVILAILLARLLIIAPLTDLARALAAV